MNAKKAKRIRQRLRASGYDATDSKATGGNNRFEEEGCLSGITSDGPRHLIPDCGRSLYRRIKQLGID